MGLNILPTNGQSEEEEKKGHFELVSKTAIKEINDDTRLQESDLCFQDDTHIFQFKYVEPKDEKKEIIKPGTFSFIETNNGLKLKETEFRSRKLLNSVVNTQSIVSESDMFFDNLDVYDELGEPKTRKILMYSDPGMGKTATITEYSLDTIKKDPGTVVIVWPTSTIEAHDVSSFLNKKSEYSKDCTRLILIMEDIGGGEREGSGNMRAVDSAMLDLLDGIQVNFKLPTLILATTNYPQNLLSALADRPGRFDLIMQLKAPSYDEQVALIEFIGKRSMTDDDKAVLKDCGKDMSIAHLKEIVVRSRLHKKELAETIKEISDHRERFKKNFEEGGSVGFGID